MANLNCRCCGREFSDHECVSQDEWDQAYDLGYCPQCVAYAESDSPLVLEDDGDYDDELYSDYILEQQELEDFEGLEPEYYSIDDNPVWGEDF